MRKLIQAAAKVLNIPGYHSTAAISTKVELIGAETYMNARVTISDCSRSICLECESDDEGERENSIYKIETLIRTLTEFKDGLLQAHDIIREKKYQLALKGDDDDFDKEEREKIIREYKEYHSS